VSLLGVVVLALVGPGVWLVRWVLGAGRDHPLLEGASVLVVTLDTLRQDRVGAYDRIERRLTPHLDRLAEESIRFTNAFSVSSFTPPSHASLFSGLYPSTHGLVDWQFRLPDAVTSLAELCLEHKVVTHAFLNLPNAKGLGLAQGFWSVVDYPGERVDQIPKAELETRVHEIFATADETADAYVDSLRQRKPEDPTFDWIHLYDVHRPYARTGDWKEHFGPAPRPRIGDLEIHYNLDPDQVRQRGLSEEDLVYVRDRYDAGVLPVDAALGRIFRELRRTGRWDRTLVIVTSDHGEALLERPEERLFTHDPFLFDEVIRIPLLMKWPLGTIPAATRDDLVSLVDVMPTIVAAAGWPAPPEREGVNLLPALRGETGKSRSFVFAEVSTERWADKVAIRTERWKLIVDRRAGTCALYDLDRDPFEREPIDCASHEEGRRLEAVLERWLDRPGAGDLATLQHLSETELERLRDELEALGYQ